MDFDVIHKYGLQYTDERWTLISSIFVDGDHGAEVDVSLELQQQIPTGLTAGFRHDGLSVSHLAVINGADDAKP